MAQNRSRPPLDLNAAALWKLVRQPISTGMVTYISEVTAGILYCNPNLKFPHDDSSQLGLAVETANDFLPTLYEFISRLVRAARVPTPTLISTLVYLTRLRSRLSPLSLYGTRCTAHRIFLSALILTSKYLNDQSPSNKKWAQYCSESAGSYSFGLSILDITRLEIQTLDLLGYNLAITAEDLYFVLEPCLRPIRLNFYYYGVSGDRSLSGLQRRHKKNHTGSKGLYMGEESKSEDLMV